MIQWFKTPKFDFMKFRRIFLMLSGLAFLAGIYASVLIIQGKANLGTEFGGGVLLQLSYSQSVDISQVRKIIDRSGFKDAIIQQVQNVDWKGYELIIRIKQKINHRIGSVSDTILSQLKSKFPHANFALQNSAEVGPAVSRRLRSDAIKAFIIAMFGILIYIAIRFDFKFGISALVTTLHDVFVVLGIVILTGHQFDLLQVTALLTLAGYSLNDTVVVFDRIRENLKYLSQEGYASIINRSVNETLNRTINTSGATFLALVPLYFIGGDTLHSFALTLILGVIVGTYSSVFVASPILLEWTLLSSGNKKIKKS
jgi:preprotein translocase SecF subunit